ncbi:MAG: EAL domain-containing protein [Rhodospirillaceae bacterium]|nr:EAL domain-containing protein [Rhodospirillaceae bacterium]
MPLHHHLLIALSYAVVAAILAVALPFNFPALEPSDSLLLGGEILLACGLVHGLLAGLGNGRLESEVAWLRLRFAELADELARARNESRLILEAIESSSRVRQGQTANIGKVMDEVRLLQGLVEQYTERHKSVGGRAQPAPPGEMPPPMTPTAAPSATSRASPVRYMKGIDDATVLDIVREALRADRIDLYLQPIVSLPQRKRRYYECFSRIRAGDDSVVMPEQYIGVAEREGLIGTIDNMLLFRCIQLVRRVQKKNQNLGFFCNISQHTLADTRFFRDFLSFLSDMPTLPPTSPSSSPNRASTGSARRRRGISKSWPMSVSAFRWIKSRALISISPISPIAIFTSSRSRRLG